VRAARVVATAMSVAGSKEGDGSKAMAMTTKIVGKWTATATKIAMATKTMVEGKQQPRQQRGQWLWQQGWWATKRAMAMAMVAIAMAMASKGAGKQ
jgi:hypothetical protein